MTADSEWYGREHTLIVHEVGEDIGFGYPGKEIEDYEIIHHPTLLGCPTKRITRDGEVQGIAYECDIGVMEFSMGLAFSLSYSGTPITQPGTYKIQGWGTKYWTELGYEYDGGIAVVDDED